jgi:hypothetical protein
MPATLLKIDHPCFFDFFDSGRTYDDFQPYGGLFSLFRSADIFAEPRDDFFVGQTADTRRNSRPDPESIADKCKTQHRTIGIGVEAIAKRTCLRSCIRPEDELDRYLSGGFRLFAVALFPKPEVTASGFSFILRN